VRYECIVVAQQLDLAKRVAQQPDSRDENVLFGTQDPFQIDMHRPPLEVEDEAEVQSTRVPYRNVVESASWAYYSAHVVLQSDKIQRRPSARLVDPAFAE
jgi:hypothetical protein